MLHPIKSLKERKYLLIATPSSLCHEFLQNAPVAFNLLLSGLIGVNEVEDVEDNTHLKDNIAVGGLREESLKLFSKFCAPLTIVTYAI